MGSTPPRKRNQRNHMLTITVSIMIALSTLYTLQKVAGYVIAKWDLSGKQELAVYVGWTLGLIMLGFSST